MAAKKYLKIGTSGFPEEEAGVQTSAGAGDADKYPALDSSGKLDNTFMPAGMGADSGTFTAGETIAAGDLVYITSTGTVMKADANDVAKAAIGFVLAGIANAASGTVYFEGSITGLTGLTRGSAYFLSATTPGAATLTVPSGAADIVQFIGRATTTTSITFEAGEPYIRL